MTEQRAKFILEVTAGVIPGTVEPEHTRQYVITGEQWAETEEQAGLLAEVNGRAQGYAGLLMLQPDHLNWVRVDWIMV